jgi:hypothetical protein
MVCGRDNTRTRSSHHPSTLHDPHRLCRGCLEPAIRRSRVGGWLVTGLQQHPLFGSSVQPRHSTAPGVCGHGRASVERSGRHNCRCSQPPCTLPVSSGGVLNRPPTRYNCGRCRRNGGDIPSGSDQLVQVEHVRWWMLLQEVHTVQQQGEDDWCGCSERRHTQAGGTLTAELFISRCCSTSATRISDATRGRSA